jgi:predicted CopG family antitoxin
MAKIIEIDDDAFSCLENARGQGENWSQLIKRCISPKRSLEDILDNLDVNISDETLGAIDDSVQRRRSAPASRHGD